MFVPSSASADLICCSHSFHQLGQSYLYSASILKSAKQSGSNASSDASDCATLSFAACKPDRSHPLQIGQ
eukprot:1865997-Prorocentrum_lima.AAC.1